MNIGTKIRTILAIATALNTANVATAFAEFGNPTVNMVYRAISLIALIIVLSANTYYNNDYTETAAKYTGMMRLEKEQMKGIITGEDFYNVLPFDEAEEEDEE